MSNQSSSTRAAAVPAPETTAADKSKRFRDLIAVNFGNTLEWYDWTIYSIFAPYFAVQFFQPDNPTSALLSTLAVFAVGFVTRPLGGFLFGAYADRAGRRKPSHQPTAPLGSWRPCSCSSPVFCKAWRTAAKWALP
jgi:MHS family alpha-ketoglutarate permease-like MFS transporter